MRPAGEVRVALQSAAQELVTVDGGQERGPTLQELAARAKVGAQAAMTTVKNMTRSGALRIVNTRKVPNRNRPVAEYGPPKDSAQDDEFVDMGSVLAMWVQR
jgi:hypothetical protein